MPEHSNIHVLAVHGLAKISGLNVHVNNWVKYDA